MGLQNVADYAHHGEIMQAKRQAALLRTQDQYVESRTLAMLERELAHVLAPVLHLVREAFKAVDPTGRGFVTAGQFDSVLGKHGATLTGADKKMLFASLHLLDGAGDVKYSGACLHLCQNV